MKGVLKMRAVIFYFVATIAVKIMKAHLTRHIIV